MFFQYGFYDMKLTLIHLFVCVFCEGAHAVGLVWGGSGDNLWELFLSFHHVDPEGQSQILSLDG